MFFSIQQTFIGSSIDIVSLSKEVLKHKWRKNLSHVTETSYLSTFMHVWIHNLLRKSNNLIDIVL